MVTTWLATNRGPACPQDNGRGQFQDVNVSGAIIDDAIIDDAIIDDAIIDDAIIDDASGDYNIYYTCYFINKYSKLGWSD